MYTFRVLTLQLSLASYSEISVLFPNVFVVQGLWCIVKVIVLLLQCDLLLDQVLLLVYLPPRDLVVLSSLSICQAGPKTVAFVFLVTAVTLSPVRGDSFSWWWTWGGMGPAHGCLVVFAATFPALGTLSWLPVASVHIFCTTCNNQGYYSCLLHPEIV